MTSGFLQLESTLGTVGGQIKLGHLKFNLCKSENQTIELSIYLSVSIQYVIPKLTYL
jgi:hypothetical protein